MSMNFWPPKPGFTVITQTRSARSSTCATASAGVPGLSATPARMPAARIAWSVRWTCGPASTCAVRMSAPAAAKASIEGSTGAIIRWTSITVVTWRRKAATAGGPKVRFGTKWLSITSTCTQSAPWSSTARISRPKSAKSAERIEGAILTARSKAMVRVLSGSAGRRRPRPAIAPARRLGTGDARTRCRADARSIVIDDQIGSSVSFRVRAAGERQRKETQPVRRSL